MSVAWRPVSWPVGNMHTIEGNPWSNVGLSFRLRRERSPSVLADDILAKYNLQKQRTSNFSGAIDGRPPPHRSAQTLLVLSKANTWSRAAKISPHATRTLLRDNMTHSLRK